MARETLVKENTERLSSNGIKILLVEDDEFLRNICKMKLEKEGFNVSVAVTGGEALKKITEDNPQAVLLDVIIPEIDGFEVLKRVKKDPSKSSIPVIMLTNLGQADEIEKGLNLGAEDYIIKAHFTIGEIIERVKDILKKKNIMKS